MSHGFAVWFTGLSGSGKSTIARLLVAELRALGHPVVMLDGDEVRAGLSSDLGFGRADRDTQVRRVGWICDLLVRSGVIAVAALVSPYRDTRREVAEGVGRFVEVYVEAGLPALRDRDTKGLYGRADGGERLALTGVDDPYEPPLTPDVHCRTDGDERPEEAAARIVDHVRERGYLVDLETSHPPRVTETYTPTEAATVRDRLAELGYL